MMGNKVTFQGHSTNAQVMIVRINYWLKRVDFGNYVRKCNQSWETNCDIDLQGQRSKLQCNYRVLVRVCVCVCVCARVFPCFCVFCTITQKVINLGT